MSLPLGPTNVNLDSYFPYSLQISNAPKPMLAHWHRQLELMFFYQTEGCEYVLRGETLQIRSGDLVIANPFELHACRNFGKNARVCCLITQLPYPEDVQYDVFPNLIHDERISEIFLRLREIDQTNPAAPMGIMSCAYELMYELLKFAVPGSRGSLREKRNTEILQVMEYIHNHLSEELKMKELASLMCLGEDRFYRVFRDVVGVSPSAYLMKARISAACGLLDTTDLSVMEISQTYGFCSSSYFAECFKTQMGCSPNAYRNRGHSSKG